MTVQQIAKKLIESGYQKIEINKELKCAVGDYEIRKFDYAGVSAIVRVNTGVFNRDFAGASIEDIMDTLSGFGLTVENRNGAIAILK